MTKFTQKPLVSIIVVSFNGLEYTRLCIQSLQDTLGLPNSRFEIIVADNNSTDGTVAYLKTLPDYFKIIYNRENLGYSKAINQGSEVAAGKYLVFLNNDIVALPGWLEEMVKIMEDESVGIVGSKLLYPDGTIQHAGLIMVKNRQDPLFARLIYNREVGDLPEANKLMDYQGVIGACMLIRKELFFEVGGFGEEFVNGNEDVDLCLKVRQKGYRVIYCPKSVLYHYESVSEGRFKYVDQNVFNMHKNWLGRVKPDLVEDDILTSIIIPVFNMVNFTRVCIKSIFKYTLEPFELIIINNGSTDSTGQYLRELSLHYNNVKVINNKTNKGFGGACNQGIKAASGEYVLILNNDAVVTEGWLARMLKKGESNKNIGIIGPRSNAVSGAQLVGRVPYSSEQGMHEFAHRIAVKYFDQGFETNRLVAFCMLVKKEVIDRIGGFDLRFGAGNFEDDDFCLRAQIAGYKLWVCNDVFVHHFASKTFLGNKLDHGRLMAENWGKFKEKWNLPINRSLEHGYDAVALINQQFDDLLHYCPLENPLECKGCKA